MALSLNYLNELQALCDAASPEPWFYHAGDLPYISAVDAGNAGEIEMFGDQIITVCKLYAVIGENLQACYNSSDNAHLIIASRHALPELIAEVKRLDIENSELRSKLLT